MALNGAIAVALPTLALVRRARAAAMPASGGSTVRASRFRGGSSRRGRSVALPLALQAVYLVCLPFAAREGVGALTSFGYAYLAAAALVAVTSSSLGLVTSVPLTRVGLEPPRRRAPRRLVVVARARRRRGGRRRLRGGRAQPLVGPVLGDGYLADVGEELGRLVALLGPWMVFAIGFSVTLPLLFVQERTRGLLLGRQSRSSRVQSRSRWLGQASAGLAGLCSLVAGVTTLATLAVMLGRLHAATPTLAALGLAALTVAALAVVAFVVARARPCTGVAAAVGAAACTPRGLAVAAAARRSSARGGTCASLA